MGVVVRISYSVNNFLRIFAAVSHIRWNQALWPLRTTTGSLGSIPRCAAVHNTCYILVRLAFCWPSWIAAGEPSPRIVDAPGPAAWPF